MFRFRWPLFRNYLGVKDTMSSRLLEAFLFAFYHVSGPKVHQNSVRIQLKAAIRSLVTKTGGCYHQGVRLGPLMGVATLAASGGVAHVLYGSAVENYLGCGRFIGNLCLRIVLSMKHLVSNKGHIVHAQQQHVIGFLKFCRLLLNTVCGYSAGGFCAVYLGTLN